MKNLIISVVAIVLLATSAEAKLRIVNLGTLDGDNASDAVAINNFGEVVGTSTCSNGIPHAFYYRNGQMHLLSKDPGAANAINDRGQIVGDRVSLTTNIWIISPPPFPIFPPTNIITFWTNVYLTPTNVFIRPFTNGPIFPITNIFIGPPIFIPNTNIIIIVGWPTNITYSPPTNILGPPTLLNSVSAVGPGDASSTFKKMTDQLPDNTSDYFVTNIYFSTQPVIFSGGRMFNLFPGTNSGTADGINDRSEIVGSVRQGINSQSLQAFSLRSGLSRILIPGYSYLASGINNRGDVVGAFDASRGSRDSIGVQSHAFLYRRGQMQDLGTLGGSDSIAEAINDKGEIVGWGDTASTGLPHAFLYHKGLMEDLGTLEADTDTSFNSSFAYAINNHGQVVGGGTTADGQHAFLYSDGIMVDLNDFVELTDTNGPPGFLELVAAKGINDRGQIVGYGDYWNGAEVSSIAFLLDLNARAVGSNSFRHK